MRNVKFAIRMLFRTPFVTIVAVASLALGIGANSAIFSVFHQILLQPVPAWQPVQLVNLGAPGPKPGSTSCNQAGDCEIVFSYPMFRDLEAKQTVFTGIAAHRAFSANLAYQGQTLHGDGMLVSGSYFPVLGLTPALGRLIAPGDDRAVGESPVAVLAHDYWQTSFGGNPGVLNQPLVVNGITMTIVGVAPEGFRGTTLGTDPKLFVPITMRAFTGTNTKFFEDRRNYWAYLFARLKPGMSIDQARAALNGPYHAIVNDVEAPLQKGMSDQTLAKFRAKAVTLEAGAAGQSGVHKEARTPLLLLLGVTGIVLLIACANIANLLLARSASRTTEMAVRLSIGASRSQLIRQLLTESCLLAVLGGIAGLLVARWTLGLMNAMLPPFAAQTFAVKLDGTVLLFAAGLSVITGLLFGLFPAWHSTRPDLATTLKGTAGQPGGAKAAKVFRTSLATVQIALAMALLASAGLFTRSLLNVARVDLGLKLDNVVTFGISPNLNGYTPERTHALLQQVEDALAAAPGVTSETASLVPLLGNSNWGNDVSVQGFKGGPDVDQNSRYNEIGPGYFRALGVPLIAGREFTRADTLGAAKVAIVNEAFAKKFGLGRDAVGKLIAQSTGNDVKLDIEIVGLVQNAKYSEVKAEIPPVFFRPYLQDDRLGNTTFYVRTAGDPGQMLLAIPRIVARLDPKLPLEQMKTMPQQIRENVFLDRFIGTLATSFAVLATLLAAVGLYGVLAYTVAQRTREFGLRMALGAAPSRVRGMVLRQVAVMTLIGGLVGLGTAILLGNFAASLLFKLQSWDPIVLASSTVILTLVALSAGFIPALRASRIDPMRALRYE